MAQRRAATDAFALLTGGVNARFDTNKLHPATLAALTGSAPATTTINPNGAPTTTTTPGGSKRARKAAARAAAAEVAAAAVDGDGDGDGEGGGVALFATNKRARTDELSAPLALPSAPRTNDPFEAANAARKALRIRVAGGDAPPLLESFAALAGGSGSGGSGRSGSSSHAPAPVPQRVLDNLAAAGWDAPTPVQRQVVPALMRGREVFGIAPTGSGKTLAFALPIVATLAAARREWAVRQRDDAEGKEGKEQQQQLEEALSGSKKKKKEDTKDKKKDNKKKEEQQQNGAAALAAADQCPPPYDPHNGPHALVVAPTAELAAQIGRVVERLTPGTGLRTCVLTAATAAGVDPGRVDVLVATPLRLVGLLPRAGGKDGGGKGKKEQQEDKQPTPTKTLDLTRALRFLVLDEADKLLSEEGGFVAQADAVLAAAGSRPWLARALLSATLPERVEHLARAALRDPLRVTVGERGAATASVDQRLLFVGQEEGKMPALRQLLLGNAAAVLGGGGTGAGAGGLAAAGAASGAETTTPTPTTTPLIVPPILIFVSTKERARSLHRDLVHEAGGRLRVDSITADQPNASRRAAVENFRLGRTWVLVATDLIGRGMDFVGVNTVVSYDFPRTGPDYVHRVGRTGRAGRKGCAVTFFTEDDAPRLRAVASIIRAAGGHVPDWMTTLRAQRPQQQQQQQRRQGAGGGEGRGGGGGGEGRGGGSGGGGGRDKDGRMGKKPREEETRRRPAAGLSRGGGGGGGVQKKQDRLKTKGGGKERRG